MTPEPRAKRPRPPKSQATPPTATDPELTPPAKARPEIVSISSGSKKTAPPKPETPEMSVADPSEPSKGDILRRPQPIPPPSDRMQYRAIGVVRGRYVPASETKFNRGVLITEDGAEIETVLLGQVMNLIKKYLDLNESHLWVVYPRTREVDNDARLHLQVVGVWEPERLQQEQAIDSDPGVSDGYFSVRGEVIFNSQDKNFVVVKVQQLPRRRGDKVRAFKIKLKGTVSMKSPGYFWDFQVQREGTTLVVNEATVVGVLPPRKLKPKRKPRPATGGSARPQRPQRLGAPPPRPASFQSIRRSPKPPVN